MISTITVAAAALAIASAIPAPPSDWTNYGGNAQRNGQSPQLGPTAAQTLWSNTNDFSIITWHPFVLDGRVFTVRESGFPQPGGPANDVIIAYDLATGQELWSQVLAYAGDPDEQWIAWIGGAHDGRVYASRSDNGREEPITALDAATGEVVWISDALTRAWAHDGVVFAPDGDLIVGDFESIVRINAEDGATVWNAARSCSVSGNCGAALSADGVFTDGVAPGGHVVVKHDLTTGQELYQSPVMPGFTVQNAPFVSPDGQTVYFSRTQNNDAVDFLYAFEDTGAALLEKWHVPVRWTTSHEHGIGPDGAIYTFSRDNTLIRLDAATGSVIAESPVLNILGTGNVSPKTVVDAEGKVYIGNGWAGTPAGNGRIWAFPADLSAPLFTLELDRPNAGGPVLAGQGILVVADRDGVYAYHTDIEPPCPGDVTGDGMVTSEDLNIVLASFGGNVEPGADGDVDEDGDVDSEDLNAVLAAFGIACG